MNKIMLLLIIGIVVSLTILTIRIIPTLNIDTETIVIDEKELLNPGKELLNSETELNDKILDENINQPINIEKQKLGFCFTMLEDAIEYASNNNLELVLLASSSEVLYALLLNQIDYGIIGRKARTFEITNNTKEEVIRSGLTLISKNNNGIDVSEIKDIQIYTYLDENIVEEYISSYDLNITYFDKEDIEEKYLDSITILIAWDDFKDHYEILTVMNNDFKEKKFRGSFLYYLE